MATPVWNQLAAPNYSAANGLIAQAMDQLTKAGEGLQGVAKDYKDTLYKRNLGAIQEYVNSAKTPEELESEGFRTGLAKLTGTMAGEYDTLAKAQIVDKAKDTLLSRKANQVSIDTNQFNLDTGRKNQLTKETTNKILAAPPEQRDALKQAAVDANAFDASAYQQYVQGEGTIRNQNNVDKLFNATYDANVENANLAPVVTRNSMKNADRNAATAEMNARTNKLQAEAAAARADAERKAKQNEKNPALLLLSGIDKIDKTYASEKLKPDNNPNAANTLTDWWNKQNSIFLSDTDLDNIKNTIETDPKLSKLSGKEKVFLAETSFQAIKNQNTLGRNILATDGNREQAAEVVKRVYSDISTRENDYLYSQKIPLYRDAVRQQMIQTGSRDPVEAARNVGMNEYEMYRTNIRTPLQSMAESLYESSGSTLPKEQFVDKFIYRSVNKESVDDLIKPKATGTISKAVPSETIKFNSPAMQIAGFADYGTAFRFEEREAEKAAQKEAAKRGDPSQEPSALAAQGQRMNNRARLNLEAQKALRNGQPFVVPALTAKPEETKPRELTPAEKRQAERMQAASLERLRAAGVQIPKDVTAVAKEVKQSVFTDTPLKVLANAVKPVPSPLVPVESQNAFKSRDNNLSINLSTGKSVPSKDPVPMPKVSWGKPAEVVTMNPMVAKLPQYKAVATFVGDGDTFKATSKQYATKGTKANGSVLCRVDSVDAPETPHPEYGKKGQPYGEEAGKKLQQMILNKEISIRIVKPANGDPNEPGLYGRDICQIEVEGANVSTELIRAGAAWLYREYNNYFTGLETVEANAKAEGRGLFSDPNAVYPPTAKHNGSLNLR